MLSEKRAKGPRWGGSETPRGRTSGWAGRPGCMSLAGALGRGAGAQHGPDADPALSAEPDPGRAPGAGHVVQQWTEGGRRGSLLAALITTSGQWDAS